MARILVVDDQILNRTFLNALLSHFGHHVSEAGDGVQALEILRKSRHDLLITDLLMPVMDGQELTRRVHDDAAIADMPVIFYTATYRASEAKAIAASLGVRWVLAKPSEPSQVLATVYEALGEALPKLPETANGASVIGMGESIALTSHLRGIDKLNRDLALLLNSAMALTEKQAQSVDALSKLESSLQDIQSLGLRLAALVEMGLDLSAQHQSAGLLDLFGRGAQDLLSSRHAAVAIMSGPATVGNFSARGLPPDRQAEVLDAIARSKAVSTAVSEGRAVTWQSSDGADGNFPAVHPSTTSQLVVPVRVQEKTYGWLYVAGRLGKEAYTEEDSRLALVVATQLGVAWSNLALYEEAETGRHALQLEIDEHKRTVAALLASEQRFRDLFECNPLPLWVHDVETLRFLDVNEVACREFGYSREEFLAMTLRDIRPPEDAAAIEWWASIEGPRETHAGIWHHRRKDGSTFPTDVFARNITYGGRAACYSCAIDVTQRLLTEERARKLSQAVEQSPVATVITDTEGHIEYVNRSFTEISGYGLEEVLGMTPAIIKSGLTPLGVYQELWATIKSGASWHGRMQNRKKNGELYWEQEDIAPLKNIQGQIVNYIAVKEDITAQLGAQEQLLESEMRLKEAQKIARVGSWRYEPDRSLFWSDEMYELFQLPRGVAPDYEAVQELIHPDDRAGPNYRALTKAIESGATEYRAEFRVIRPDGQVRTIFSQGKIRRDADGRMIEAVGTVQDMTERRQAEDEIRRLNDDLRGYAIDLEQRVAERTAELAAANEQLKSFDYSVSHDLRAPLTRIRGFTAMLSEECVGKVDARGVDLLRRISTAGDEMEVLIGDLLELSMASAGPLARSEVDVTALANAIFDDLQRTQPARHIDFMVEPAISVQGDPGLLRVVLQNLIGNAWKFTSKRDPGRIEVGKEAVDGTVILFVRDNGAGFDQASAGKLFAPFRRLHAKSEYPGTGIGLATVQRIVGRHGGRVWANGEVDKGATFRLTLAP